MAGDFIPAILCRRGFPCLAAAVVRLPTRPQRARPAETPLSPDARGAHLSASWLVHRSFAALLGTRALAAAPL